MHTCQEVGTDRREKQDLTNIFRYNGVHGDV